VVKDLERESANYKSLRIRKQKKQKVESGEAAETTEAAAESAPAEAEKVAEKTKVEDAPAEAEKNSSGRRAGTRESSGGHGD